MKNQKTNKNRKFTFNAIDALIILFIVALIALTVYAFVLDKDFTSKSNGDNSGTQTTDTKDEAKQTSISYVNDVAVVERRL